MKTKNEVATTPGLLVRVRQSIPRQVNKKSGVSEEEEEEEEVEEKGVRNSQGGKDKHLFFFSLSLSLSGSGREGLLFGEFCRSIGIYPGERRGNAPQYSCLEDFMDRGAWWAAVHGVTKSQIQLSN